MMKRLIRFIPFLLIPSIVVIVSLLLKDAHGPYWLSYNSDPDYAYLMNSLSLIDSKPIFHVDHPGTPVHTLGALTIRVLSLIRGEDTIKGALLNPEVYMNAIHAVMLASNAILLIITAITTYFLTKNIFLSLLIQLTPLSSTTIMYYALTKVSPEPILLLSTLILVLNLILISFYKISYKFSAVLFSFAFGLGMAAKITFFPLLVIPLIILPKIKTKLIFLLGTVLWFYFFTKSITSSYSYLFSWIKSIFNHSGRHGTGENSIIDLATFLPNLKSQIFDNPFSSSILVAGIIIYTTVRFNPLLIKNLDVKIPQKILLSLILAQIIQLITVAKHPGPQYLIPGLSLSIITLVMVIIIITSTKLYKRSLKNSLIFRVGLGLFMIYFAIYTTSQATTSYHNLNADNKAASQIYNTVQSNYKNDVLISYFRSSSPLYALRFGNTFAGENFTNYLSIVYPNAYFWDIWNARFTHWSSEPVDFKTILANRKGQDILFQGTPFETIYKDYPNYRPKIPLINILSGANIETVYKVDLDNLPK